MVMGGMVLVPIVGGAAAGNPELTIILVRAMLEIGVDMADFSKFLSADEKPMPEVVKKPEVPIPTRRVQTVQSPLP